MPEPQLSMGATSPDDDLPRTFRRDKEARERQTREAEARATQRPAHTQAAHTQPHAQSSSRDAGRHADRGYASATADLASTPEFAERVIADSGKVTVGAFDVPFVHMVRFFLKAVFAAIPALILLFVVLWAIGQTAQKFMPWLVKVRILVQWQ